MDWVFTRILSFCALFAVVSCSSALQSPNFVGQCLPLTDLDKNPLKILLIVEPTPFSYVCGYANRFKEMIDCLKHFGDQFHVVTPDKQSQTEYNGFPITSLKGFAVPQYKDVTVSMDLKFVTGKVVKNYKPDLIHVSSPSLLMLHAILWAKYYSIPLVASYHTDLPKYLKLYLNYPGIQWLSRQYLRILHNFCDLTLCTSPQLKEDLVRLGIKRIDIWQKGINTKVFSPTYKSDEMRLRLSNNNNPNAPLLLYVGRLGFEKRIERLKEVLERNPTARLALIGRGPAEASLRAYFKDLPVQFMGEMQGVELSQAYASSDIFVMPSDTETLGFVVMEALASGIPTIGVHAGGLPDIIQHNVTGYLANNSKEDNMIEFSNYVKELIENKEKYEEMKNNAVGWANQWSWEEASRKLRYEQYPKALDRHRKKKGLFRRFFRSFQ